MADTKPFRIRTYEKRGGGQTKGPEAFAYGPLQFRVIDSRLQLRVEEESQCEGEQRKRLDEHETENHGRANAASRSRVPSDALACRCRNSSLAQTAAERRDGYAEANRDHQSGRVDRRLSRFWGLRERRRCNDEHRDERDQNNCCFLHNFLLMNCRQEVVPGHRAAGLTLERLTNPYRENGLVLVRRGQADVDGGQNREHVRLNN